MQKTFKQKLQNNELTIGSWITLGNTGIAEIMSNVGFDWLVVDMEHSMISMEMAGELIRVVDLAGVPILVRLTSNQPDQIKRIMDAGAHGIIVPMVNNMTDAKKAVEAVHFPPKGNRSVGLARAQGYGNKFSEYLKWQEDGPVVIVQIEHREALKNLDGILTVPGIDGFIIGPYDLSCSLGIPGEFESSEFVDSIELIKNTGLQKDVPGGIHIVEPDTELLKQSIRNGFKFVAYSVDFRILDVGLRKGMNSFKEICG